MKKVLLVVALAVSVSMLGGCAAFLTPSIYAQQYYGDNASVSKTAEKTSQVWLNFFGTESYPSAAKVAKENGISKIASVERYSKAGIFFLWTEYTTVVSGE